MKEIFALQVHFCPTHQTAPPLCMIQGSRPSAEIRQQSVELMLKCLVLPGPLILVRELLQGSHQGFRHKHTTELTKMAGGIRGGRRSLHSVKGAAGQQKVKGGKWR